MKNQKVSNVESGNIEFLDDKGRENIYLWSEERTKRHQKFIYTNFHTYNFNLQVIKAFFSGFNFIMALSIILSMSITYVCMLYDVAFEFQATIFLTPFVYPLTFLINNDFGRREIALRGMSDMKAFVYTLFVFLRNNNQTFPCSLNIYSLNKLKQLVVHFNEFLLTRNYKKRNYIIQVIYEDLNDISQAFVEIMLENNLVVTSVIYYGRISQLLENIIRTIENLRVIRDYRSPLSTRAFTKVMTFLLPTLFAPLYVGFGKEVSNTSAYSPYIISFFVSFVFAYLQSIQDRLYDPFMGVSCDDINLDELTKWQNVTLQHKLGRRPPKDKSSVIHYLNRFGMGETVVTNPEDIKSDNSTPNKVNNSDDTKACYISNDGKSDIDLERKDSASYNIDNNLISIQGITAGRNKYQKFKVKQVDILNKGATSRTKMLDDSDVPPEGSS